MGEEGTRRDHLVRQWEATGVIPEEIEAHLAPRPEISHLWDHFLFLHRRRGSNGFGPSALTAEDMKWLSMRGIKLRPWEVEAIVKADDQYLLVQAEVSARKGKGTPE